MQSDRTADSCTDQSRKVDLVIPCHDEERLLGRCLQSILDQETVADVRLIIVPNGCTDQTRAIAESFQPRIAARGWSCAVAPVARASKPAALNAGDALCRRGAARLYIDADIRLSRRVVEEISTIIAGDGPVEFAAPAIEIVPARSRVTSHYCRIWSRLPCVRRDVIGAGFYAVSAIGRQRWGAFPNIISDDKFARLHFDENERRVLDECSFQIHLPEGWRELTRIRGRWTRGNNQLAAQFPKLAARDRRRYGRTLAFIAARPSLWISSVVFLAVFLAGWRHAISGRHIGVARWERARSTRQGEPGTAILAQSSFPQSEARVV